MNSLWSSRAGSTDAQAGDAVKKPSNAGVDAAVPAETSGEASAVAPDAEASSSTQPVSGSQPGPPTRPPLARNQASQPPPAVPPPPSQPPPAAPQQPPDSLSLAQLRRIVADFPRSEPLAYAYTYEDCGPFEVEIDEWFVNPPAQKDRLREAEHCFSEWFAHSEPQRPSEASPRDIEKLLRGELRTLSGAADHNNAILWILYVVLGRFKETAVAPNASQGRSAEVKSAATDGQLQAMKAGVLVLVEAGGLGPIWTALKVAFDTIWAFEPQQPPNDCPPKGQGEALTNLMTIMYIIIQHAISYPDEMSRVRKQLLDLDPTLVSFMLDATAKLRWNETVGIPQTRVFLLLWKSILLVFGGTRELEVTKKATSETSNDDKEKNVITASPLDYHAFRQEITSKYPAYIPPQAVLPLEADNTSLLPPLPHQPSRNSGANGILPGPANSQASGASILHQPVHIATPAPSPPPSPGVGGKGGKKQNYQTNQNFPFMYPPLDATSNSAGGKGNAGLQDLLVGRKWEGSDAPASILEAGELFSERVRMTRATRQLWEERERFIRFSRGWDDRDDDLIDDLDLSSLTPSEREELGLLKEDSKPKAPPASLGEGADYGPNPEALSEEDKRRLDAVEKFYRESLPQLQSLVIVLLKAILFQITVLMTQPPPGQGPHPGGPAQNGVRGINGPAGLNRGAPEVSNGSSSNAPVENVSLSPEELEHTRTREITSKAVSGILVLLLKWLKLSHILKFEYLGQLLLDSNYLPLVLKLFSHHDIQQTVDSKCDRVESSFFYLCNALAGATEAKANEQVLEESEDEAMPPPIRRHRSPLPTHEGVPPPAPEVNSSADAQSAQQQRRIPPVRPEVDELGCPVNDGPREPITDFSARNFFWLINLLRVMQKVCKGKAHRNLLLVHSKSSNVLRKTLRAPQQELRLYTLKLFKSQVPYCGRKWRQGNMRVITAVYLHCRPELRDEWLAGSDVDAEVEEALPLEQALRSLTHWFNVRRYPLAGAGLGEGSLTAEAALLQQRQRDENDFFVRELERADIYWPGSDYGDDAGSIDEWSGVPA